jgi:hypothetical protein
MTFNPAIHHRKSIRLRDYDYAQAGWYFITICTHQRQLLFGEIVDGGMVLNAAGKIVEKVWHDLPEQYSDIQIKESVVMPNHFHGIVQIVGAQFIAPKNSGATNQGVMNYAPTGLGRVVRCGLLKRAVLALLIICTKVRVSLFGSAIIMSMSFAMMPPICRLRNIFKPIPSDGTKIPITLNRR